LEDVEDMGVNVFAANAWEDNNSCLLFRRGFFVRMGLKWLWRAVCFFILLLDSPFLYAQQPGDAFDSEIGLANNAFNRSDRLKHLQNALLLRPGHPENIAVEYRIAIVLAQHGDIDNRVRPQPDEAIPWFQGIIEKYNHIDYYESSASTGTWDSQFMVPRAKVQLASLYLNKPGAGPLSRDLLFDAMEDIEITFNQRKEDWLAAPEPKLGFSESTGDSNRRIAASEGLVFHEVEVQVIEAAVRQYGFTYGRQQSWEVEETMLAIINRFPDTPMATIARRHIDRAAHVTMSSIDRQLDKTVRELVGDNEFNLAHSSLIIGDGENQGAGANTPDSDGRLLRSTPTSRITSILFWIGGGGVLIFVSLMAFYLLQRMNA